MRRYLSILFLSAIHIIFAQSNDTVLQQKFDTIYSKVKFYREMQEEDSMLFYGRQALVLSKKLDNDILSAKTEIAIGNFYLEKNSSDSTAYRHFYNAYNNYLKSNDSLKIAKTILRLGIIEKNNNYLIKSKESLFLALEFLEGKDTNFLHEIYNSLGVVFNYLGDNNKSIHYYQKSLALRRKMGNPELILQSYNNIAASYENFGNYEKALLYYQKGLELVTPDIENSNEYARLLDNSTHLNTSLGIDKEHQLENYKKALELRENNEELLGIIASNFHIAEYYQKQNDFKNSNTYAKKAYALAKESETYIDAIRSLDVLISNYQSNAQYQQAFEYSQERQNIITKKNQHELAVGEKFADIRFESQEKEKENNTLRIKNKEQALDNQQQRLYIYLILGAFFIMLLGGLLLLSSMRLKSKQRELLLQQKEREAEKEIEKLLHQQQAYAERSKQKEQERISHDLHDSIAGKLSGVMLQVDNLSQKVQPDLQPKVETLADYLSDIIQETHAIVQDLNQDRIIQTSFQTILEQLIQNQLACTIHVTTDMYKPHWEVLPCGIKVAVYYIIQQALRNIQEHSEATRVMVRITQDIHQLQIEIKDNGKGFTSSKYNIGIPSMKKRAESAGGHFSIQSQPDQGTSIHLKFPLS